MKTGMAYGRNGMVTYRGWRSLGGYMINIEAPGRTEDREVLHYTWHELAVLGCRSLGQLLRREGWPVDGKPGK